LIDHNTPDYREKLHSIIALLERAEALSARLKKDETRAYTLYLLGYFHYKTQDFFAAKEKLQQSVSLKSPVNAAARTLLANIWSYPLRPPWWQWWLYSPLHPGLCITIFLLCMLGIGSFLLLPLLKPSWFSHPQGRAALLLVVGLSMILLLSPYIHRITVRDIAVEISARPPSAFVLTPATMEERIVELGKKTMAKGWPFALEDRERFEKLAPFDTIPSGVSE
ncbi:MAG: hypothetical protein WBC42_05110, partial [Candidatus Zixiibacteriota bacterium]